MSRILVLNDDRLGPAMAGPPIRAMHLAAELAADGTGAGGRPVNEVRLVSTRGCDLVRVDVDCRYVPYERLHPHVAWADVVVLQGFVLDKAPWIAETDKIIVVDLYDPMHLEQLAMAGSLDPTTRKAFVHKTVRVLNEQIDRGDYFLVASDLQRSFWLGSMASLGRLNPWTYDEDPSLATRVAVVPFGLPAEPPEHTAHAIKSVVPGIGKTDKVLLWAGGVYNWFDPLTLIRAVHEVSATHDNVRLFFLGMGHPDPEIPEMATAAAARQLADSLGATGKTVFFNEGWVDYESRQNYLLDSDIGVSTHAEHLETTFSFRTRMLDYLWAGLPMISTRGDSFASLIDAEGLGLTVDEGDVDGLTDALRRLLDDPVLAGDARTAVARVRQQFTWPTVAAPLVEFCRAPSRAPDIGQQRLEVPNLAPVSVRGDLALVREYLRAGGAKEVARRARGRISRVLRDANH
jgi:hypothetical protein